MDPDLTAYLAKLTGRPTRDEEREALILAEAAKRAEAAKPPMLLKKYYKDDRVFIRVKGILPAEQNEMLRVEMPKLLSEMEQIRARTPLLRRKPDVPMGGAS
jgi:hypothetical protein